jgi:hypothetical protein
MRSQALRINSKESTLQEKVVILHPPIIVRGPVRDRRKVSGEFRSWRGWIGRIRRMEVRHQVDIEGVVGSRQTMLEWRIICHTWRSMGGSIQCLMFIFDSEQPVEPCFIGSYFIPVLRMISHHIRINGEDDKFLFKISKITFSDSLNGFLVVE